MFHCLGRETSNEILHDVDKQIRHSWTTTNLICFFPFFVAFFDFNTIFLLEASLCFYLLNVTNKAITRCRDTFGDDERRSVRAKMLMSMDELSSARQFSSRK